MTSHPAGRTRGGRGMPRAAVFCMAASAFLAASTFPATAAQAASSSASSSFDRVFAAQGEPASTHFAAEYRTGGVAHRVEVWRDGERRIRRRTDDAAESIALRKPDSPEFKLSVFDLKRHIVTDIDRSNLYRIGNFTDWYDLGHGLRHPKGAYTLRAAGCRRDLRMVRPDAGRPYDPRLLERQGPPAAADAGRRRPRRLARDPSGSPSDRGGGLRRRRPRLRPQRRQRGHRTRLMPRC
jgi:hypothetical protein